MGIPEERFMRLAIEKAQEGVARGQSPFGACIVRDGAVIACEHNVVWAATDVTAHAEVHAIRVACARLRSIDLSGGELYSTCEPCPMCFSAAHWAKLRRVVFGTRIDDARACGFSELGIPNVEMKRLGGSPLEITGDFLREESLAIFQQWMARADRRSY